MKALLIMLLPPAEILLTIKAAQVWGWGPVLLCFVAGFVLGSAMMRLRGKVFFKEAMSAVGRDEMPTEAILGGMAWFVAGVLLMIPGFITDVLALLVLLPPVRRRVLLRFAQQAEQSIMMMQRAGQGGAMGGFQWPPQSQDQGDVFEGEAHEVADDEKRIEAPESNEPQAAAEKKTPPEGGA